MINNHLNLPKKIVFETGEITYLYDATGVKLKKTVTDNASQTTNTHYIDGFQYTGDHLDFFPHAEGYVNVLDFSEFHYIYTYKDHTSAPLSTGLGNMRLKYTKDPGSNQTEIMEENHYYPYGMTHKGYNASHPIFWQMPGIGIDLVEVTPLMGDKYKYGFGGMEYQEELALNHYDFGARNGVYPERSRGNPALGRWMNLDPLAEMMRRHSPYNYAFNNPVFFIDPDGMTPIAGALKSGLLVQDTNFLGTSDISDGTMGSIAIGENMAPEKNNSAAYKNFFKQVQEDVANADMSLGGDNKCCENDKKTPTPSPKWYKEAFNSILKHKFRTNFTFDDAIWHYRLGGGEPVDVNTNSLDFSSLSVKDFQNPDFTHQESPGIFLKLSDISNAISNTNQALIYGTIEVVYIGENTIMVLPNDYDFDIKLTPTVRGVLRDFATMLGHMYNGSGTPYTINFMGTAKIKN